MTQDIGNICIVANELNHLFRNGGIGTHNWLLAEALSDAGWNVHVLYCSEVETQADLVRCREMWKTKGITLWHLSEFRCQPEDDVECGLIGWLDKHSMQVRRALEQLNDTYQFDLVEFAEWAGYGFRTVQAHSMNGSLSNTRVIVRLHSSSQWCRDGNRIWMCNSDDLIRDYLERYSFEQADVQLSPSQYMFDYARNLGWAVRNDARVIPYCNPASTKLANAPGAQVRELVFFGRLESRKGLTLFLEMARELPREMQISFVGKETSINGVPAGQLIKRSLGDRPFKLHTSFDRQQAMDYLSAPDRLAIMPSLIENYPFTVLECATSGIPFLAANVGGIPEIVADNTLRQRLLFDPTPVALRTAIEHYIALDSEARCRLVQRMHEICNSARNRAAVSAAYAELLPQKPTGTYRLSPQTRRSSVTNVCDQPLVTIAVPYFNLGSHLPECLASVAAQDYPRTEVIVVNDGSTDAHSLDVWHEMQASYPSFLFVTQENHGLGAARNTGLALARGAFFLPIDADNIARPDMVSRFVHALQRNIEVSVATCFFLAFDGTTDISQGKFQYAYRPCGGPYVAAALRNVYGDANAMSRTAALRSVGGYETEKHTTCEDWEMYVKLVRHGHRIDVVPEYLFYYRHRAGSLLRTTDAILNRRRVLRQFFPSADLPAAEQIQLWTALVSFDEAQRRIQWGLQPPQTGKQRRGVRRAVHEVKQVLRKSPYYRVVSGKLKKLKQHVA